MTEGKIPSADRKNSYCIYCPDVLKVYQREIIFVEFLRYANREIYK